MDAPTLSVITVCFRVKEALSATVDSLLSQTWTDFEYLVIDGGSDDGTVPFLEQLEPLFSAKQIPFFCSSEPDHGIYDAMNKGIRKAHGKWLLFLNAGDLLADSTTLEQVFAHPSDASILYGDTRCIYEGQTRLYPALPLDHLTYEMAFCHQSVFVKRELLLEHPYDISYRVCADHEFFLAMYLKGVSFYYLPIPISVYEIAGFSDRHKMLSHKEKIRMQKELGIFHITPAWILRECSFYGKQTMKHLFGTKLIRMVRKRRLR